MGTEPALPTWSVVGVGQLGDGDTLPARGANSLVFSRERDENPSVDTPLARTGNTRLSERFLGRLLADDTAIVRGDTLCLVELRGFDPLTPCMPLMCGWFTSQRATSPSHATEQVRGAVEDRVVRRREAACSAVSGKSLARTLRAVDGTNTGAIGPVALDHCEGHLLVGGSEPRTALVWILYRTLTPCIL